MLLDDFLQRFSSQRIPEAGKAQLARNIHAFSIYCRNSFYSFNLREFLEKVDCYISRDVLATGLFGNAKQTRH